MKKPRSVKVSTFGRKWKMRLGNLSDAHGYCWPDTREIVIDRGAVNSDRLREIIIHEMLHKLFPWMTEDAVELAAVEIDAAIDAFEELRSE